MLGSVGALAMIGAAGGLEAVQGGVSAVAQAAPLTPVALPFVQGAPGSGTAILGSTYERPGNRQFGP
jgi:hypothetical protein